jgi:hypothetical protein
MRVVLSPKESIYLGCIPPAVVRLGFLGYLLRSQISHLVLSRCKAVIAAVIVEQLSPLPPEPVYFL